MARVIDCRCAVNTKKEITIDNKEMNPGKQQRRRRQSEVQSPSGVRLQ